MAESPCTVLCSISPQDPLRADNDLREQKPLCHKEVNDQEALPLQYVLPGLRGRTASPRLALTGHTLGRRVGTWGRGEVPGKHLWPEKSGQAGPAHRLQESRSRWLWDTTTEPSTGRSELKRRGSQRGQRAQQVWTLGSESAEAPHGLPPTAGPQTASFHHDADGGALRHKGGLSRWGPALHPELLLPGRLGHLRS